MANDMVRRRDNAGLAEKSKALKKTEHGHAKKHAKKAAKHIAKHAAKHAAKKQAKKTAKKSAKHVGHEMMAMHQPSDPRESLRAAFHDMQRASVVISLMEKDTGEDLRDLLTRGVKLYERALEEEVGDARVWRALGVLRAAEHLSMAGLYSARHKHRQKVSPADPEWLGRFVAEIERRLERVEGLERSKGPDLYPATVEMLRQAEEADDDAHLAYELVMAAEALCFALENGL
jgi:hypothetical protein